MMDSRKAQEQEPMPSMFSSAIALEQHTWSQRHFKGWRFGILFGATLATIVLLVNLGFAIHGGIISRSQRSSTAVLFQGDCNEAARLSVAAHLLINILSTLLLGASNYGMQCLSAPTRKEIDAAHAKKIWLDIGVLSVRNLSQISPRRTILWILLGISSLPLHLFYNSAVYSSIYSVGYNLYFTTEDVLNSSNSELFLSNSWANSLVDNETATYMWESYKAKNLTRLENIDCIKAYAVTFQTSHGNLIAVADSNSTIGSDEVDIQTSMGGSSGCSPDPFGWICGGTGGQACNKSVCSTKSIDSKNWKPFGASIQYCLAEQIESKCAVRLFPSIAYTIIVFNAFKAAVLLYTFFLIKENPLMTAGDAISSFLRYKDETTAGLCLMSKHDITWWDSSSLVARPSKIVPKKWGEVISKRRWTVFISLYFIILAVCVFLFYYGLVASQHPASELMKLRIGAIDLRTFIYLDIPERGISKDLFQVFVANSPQPILSLIYYAYNGLLTSFLFASEFNGFARSRKGLRVTSPPVGFQRSSYTLQLPKRWAIPLLFLSAFLHWLCSQSLFLVSIEVDYQFLESDNLNEIILCAYSPVGIICTISVGVAMIGFITYLSMLKFRSPEMPVVGSCSAAISACCHLPEADPSVATTSMLSSLHGFESKSHPDDSRSMISALPFVHSMGSYEKGYEPEYRVYDRNESLEVGAETCQMRVMWGVTEDTGFSKDYFDEQGKQVKNRVRHCGFSSRRVETPIEGNLYAG